MWSFICLKLICALYARNNDNISKIKTSLTKSSIPADSLEWANYTGYVRDGSLHILMLYTYEGILGRICS